MRTEKDIIGEKKIPAGALYGIHSLRAKENFPNNMPFHIEWYKAAGVVKQAYYQTYQSFFRAIESTCRKVPVKLIDYDTVLALERSAAEVAEGRYFEHFIVPAIQGGAGTSINMNINEIIANVTLLKMGRQPGEYAFVDPIEHANVFQSTNDVIPSALKVAVMFLLDHLEGCINRLRLEFEGREAAYRDALRIAYTQMQEAVPSSFGRLFSTYSDALSRDWWRISKCRERIRQLNLGGGAAGTGLSVPRFFIMEVTQCLQRITGLPVTRGENLSDVTSNLDTLVEVHAILKAHAVNLEKIANDLRLLASDINNGLLRIPQKQVGSSIMPGKVNPVITEFVISSTQKVFANDVLISNLCAQGCLDLNPYLPVIGNAMIESLKLLAGADESMQKNLVGGMELNRESSLQSLLRSPSVTTALIPYVGYNRAAELARVMRDEGIDIFSANERLGIMDPARLNSVLSAPRLLKEGFSINDLISE